MRGIGLAQRRDHAHNRGQYRPAAASRPCSHPRPQSWARGGAAPGALGPSCVQRRAKLRAPQHAARVTRPAARAAGSPVAGVALAVVPQRAQRVLGAQAVPRQELA